MDVIVRYHSGFEKHIENVTSMSTSVDFKDGMPIYEVSIVTRGAEHIVCHEIKTFDIVHSDFTWEHYKGGMRCPNCSRVVRMKFSRRDPLTYCPYCGSKNRYVDGD